MPRAKKQTALVEETRPREFGTFDKNPVRQVVVKPTGSGQLDRIVHEGDTIYLLVKAEVQLPKFGRDKGKLSRIHQVKVLDLLEPDGVVISRDDIVDMFDDAHDRRSGAQKLPGLGSRHRVEAESNGHVRDVQTITIPEPPKARRRGSKKGGDAA